MVDAFDKAFSELGAMAKSAGKQAVRGIVDIPENWMKSAGLIGDIANAKIAGVPLGAILPVPGLQGAHLNPEGPAAAKKWEDRFKAEADTLYPAPPPANLGESFIRGATGALADPLSYIAPGTIAGNVAGAGLLGGAFKSAADALAPSAPTQPTTPPIAPTATGDAFDEAFKGSIGPTEKDAFDKAFTGDDGSTPGLYKGLGAAAAAAAGLLIARRALRPPVTSGRNVQTVGSAADVAASPVSATLPREGRMHVQVDDKYILGSQAARSLKSLPENQPLPNLEGGVDVFTKGVPEQGSLGAKLISEQAHLYGPPVQPTTTVPIAPGATKKEVLQHIDQLVHETSTDSLASRATHFIETGMIKTPDKDDHFLVGPWGRIVPKQLFEREAITPGWADDAQYYRGLRQALDDYTYKSTKTNEVAPTLTRLLGERNMLPTPRGDMIPDATKPGRVDPQLVAAAKAEIQRLESNPEFKRHVKEVEAVPRFLMKLGQKYGMSPVEANKMMAQHPHYMPTRETRTPLPVHSIDRWWEKMKSVYQLDKNIADSVDQFKAFHRRAETHGGGVQMPHNFMEELFSYIPVVMHTFSRNDAQRKLFYILRNSEDNKIARSFRVYAEGDKRGKGLREVHDATFFWDGNVRIGVKFEDELMNQAFRLMPGATRMGAINALRRTMQQTTTGLLSLFPLSKAFLYDSLIAHATRPAGSVGGGPLGRVGSEPVKLMHDTLKGAASVLIAKNKLRAAEDINRHIAKNSQWYQEYERLHGAGSARRFANDLVQAYTDSTYGQLRASGALGSTQYLERVANANNSRLESAIPVWKNRVGPGAAWQAWHGYKAIVEGLLNSHRVMYAMRNKARPNVAQETASLLGDFTKRGSGIISSPRGGSIKYQEPDTFIDKLDTLLARAVTGRLGQFVSTGLQESVPYYNVAVQGTRLLTKRLSSKDNWASTLGGITATIVVPAILSQAITYGLGPEYQQYWKSLPGYMRAGVLYMPLPGLPPERGLHIPVPPELSVVNSVVNYGFASILGMFGAPMNKGTLEAPTNPYIQDDIADAIGNWMNVFSPLPLSLVMSLGGVELRNRGQSLAGDFANIVPFPDIQKSQRESLSGVGYAKRPNAVLPGWIEDAFNIVGGTAFGMLNGMFEAALKAEGNPIGAGLTQLGNDVLRRTPVYKPVHGFHAEAASNNAKRRLAEKTALVDRITNVVDTMRMAGGVSQRFPTPLPLDAANMPPQWNDPVWRQRAFAVKQAFDGDPALRRLIATRGELRKEIEALSAKRPLTASIQKEINMRRQRELAMSESMYQSLRDKEASLGFRLEEIDPRR